MPDKITAPSCMFSCPQTIWGGGAGTVRRPFLGGLVLSPDHSWGVRYCPQTILGGLVLSPDHSWGVWYTVPRPFLGGLVLSPDHSWELGTVPSPFLGVRYCPQPILGGSGTVPSPFLGGQVLFTAHISQLGARGHQTTHVLLLSVYFQKNMFGEGVDHPYGWYSTPSTLAFPCTCTWESKGGGL